MAALPDPDRERSEKQLRDHEDATEQAERARRIAAASTPAKPAPSIRTSIEPREAACPSHGRYLAKGYRLGVRNPREIWSKCPACEAADAQLRADEEAAEVVRRQREAHEAAVLKAEIPKRFRGRDFDSFLADTDGKRTALTKARDFAEQFPDALTHGTGLVFAGLPGTGKTHLAAAILQSLVQRYAVRYVTCMGLIRMVRDTWHKSRTISTNDLYRLLGEELQLLVIDEVGVQYGTEGEQNILFEIIDRRYSERMPTILLTNLDRAGFKSLVGDRVLDRLRETARWVPFEWDSHRAKVRNE